MSPNLKVLIIIILIGIGMLVARNNSADTIIPVTSSNNSSSVASFPVTHYRQADIQNSISAFPPLPNDSSVNRARGGVVSHHLLAANNIARYFQNLGLSTYKRVVIIGPNHGELGSNHLVTSVEDWETPYGKVSSDVNLVNELLSSGGLVEDKNVLASDHAIEVLVPYVKLYIPKAKIIPVLVSAKTSDTEITKLVESMRKIDNSETLFLVSSDFSHYLMPSVAKIKDEETLALIKSFQIKRISKLGNDHIDSGTSLAILLRVMQELGTTDMSVFDHTDGSTIASQLSSPTTTYYFLNYYE